MAMPFEGRLTVYMYFLELGGPDWVHSCMAVGLTSALS